MKLHPLWLALAAGAVGACVPKVAAPLPAPADPAEVVQAIPTPTPQPAPWPNPSGPANFVFAGQLTQGGWIRGQAPGGTVSARLGDRALVLDEAGHFFAAFDRDAGPSIRLLARLADGSEVAREFSVDPRAWQIEHLNIARRPGGSTDAFLRLREPELVRIAAARAVNADAAGWQQDFIWPLTGRISGRFGSQRVYRGEPASYHSGLDIATGGSGNPFVAPAAGVVVLAAETPFTLEGNLLIIDHGQGLNSAFLHLSRIDVREGERVEQGQVLGTIGATGRTTGPHLHWSIKWHDTRLDPLLFLPPMP